LGLKSCKNNEKVNTRNEGAEIRRGCIPNTNTKGHCTYLIASDAEVVVDPSRVLELEAANSAGDDADVERLWARPRVDDGELLAAIEPPDPNCKLTPVTDLDVVILHRCTVHGTKFESSELSSEGGSACSG